MNTSAQKTERPKPILFQLFVAGHEPYSRMAIDNLQKFCAAHIREPVDIEIVDVLESFQIALDKRIFLTPALVKASPEPAVTVFGDLSDPGELLKILGMEGEE